MSEVPFILFGQQHLIALVLLVLTAIFLPLYVKNKLSTDSQKAISITLAIFLILHELSKPFYRTYFFDDELITSPSIACLQFIFVLDRYLFGYSKKSFF